ncbi:MAG: ATP-dependent helicase [Phycisphaerales bacterium]|nr:ATP-dependent helicase [Phycisphaerales bacterium]
MGSDAVHDLLGKLNAAQKQAVLHDARDGGALIVLAGPGTGKTRVIINRIAHQIIERSVKPESILAVTFTVKATQEMQNRLGEELHKAMPNGRGAAVASAVNVHTFHGLGMVMLRRFSDLLGLPPRIDLIDSVQHRRLLMEIIREKKLFKDSSARGIETTAKYCADLFDHLSNHAVEPAAAVIEAERWQQRVEADTQLKPAERDGQRAKARDFADAAALYDESLRRCIDRGTLTYSDLITLPIRLLRTHAKAAAIVRSELRHCVVDEFQDMNRSQIELLSLLLPPSKTTDVCVVGDDDQSIYAFRGADDRAFDTFASRYPAHTKVRLEENYRSGKRIIAVSNAAIALAAHRFDPSKTVRQCESPAEKRSAEELEGRVEAVALKADTNGGAVIAATIRADQRSSPARTLNDYAVVARSHAQLSRVAAALELEGIPIRRLKAPGKLDNPAVRVILAWVYAVLDERNWSNVISLLVSAPVSIPGEVALRLVQLYERLRSLHEIDAEAHPDPGAFLPWVAQQPEAPAVLAVICQEIQTLRAECLTQTASEMIRRIVHTSAVASSEILPARERARRVSAIVGLLRFVAARQERLDPPGGLSEFMRDYAGDIVKSDEVAADPDDDDDDDRSAPREVEGVKSDETDEEDASVTGTAPSAGGAVTLMTVHTAKGLEFDTVFVPGVSPTNKWPNGRKPEPTPIEEPPGFLDSRTPEEKSQARADEERRLFYVACTRAKRRLVVLSKANKNRSKGTNYFEELTLDEPAKNSARRLTEDEALRAASMIPADEWSITREREQTRREVVDRLKHEARREAADALDAIDAPNRSAEDLRTAADRLTQAAAKIAALNDFSLDNIPQWASEYASVAPLIIRARAALASPDDLLHAGRAASVGELFSTPGLVLQRPTPPLKLSYSKLDAYDRCPMCYFLRYVLGMPEDETNRTILGTVAHAALERFYRLWTEADNEGQPKPTLDRLIAIARAEFLRSVPKGHAPDRDELTQLEAQLRTLFSRLHEENAHILELERAATIPFTLGGHVHTIDVKIDRIDREDAADGSTRYRIIDYKTGANWQSLSKPKDDNLQLGLYAKALDQLFPEDLGPNGHVQGSAEYWILHEGLRGTIDLSAINHTKIDKAIAKVIQGILAGNWAPDDSERHTGLCKLLLDRVKPEPKEPETAATPESAEPETKKPKAPRAKKSEKP